MALRSEQIKPWAGLSRLQLEYLRDARTGRLQAINLFIAPRIEIQLGRSSYNPESFWYFVYDGVAQVASDGVHADNWIQAARMALDSVRREIGDCNINNGDASQCADCEHDCVMHGLTIEAKEV